VAGSKRGERVPKSHWCQIGHAGQPARRQQRLTRAQWDRELKKMTGWGAQIKDEEREGFLDYLFANYGPRLRGR